MNAQSLEECCIQSKDAEVCTCQVNDVLDVISKKWSLLIVRAIRRSGKAGYNDLLKILKGISPSTLAQRLKELQKAGLLGRKVVGEAPIRVEYALTNEGQEFVRVVGPLMDWASRRGGKTLSQIKS